MNTNVQDKKGDGEKEKDTERKENNAEEAGYNKEVMKSLRPATVATATETMFYRMFRQQRVLKTLSGMMTRTERQRTTIPLPLPALPYPANQG